MRKAPLAALLAMAAWPGLAAAQPAVGAAPKPAAKPAAAAPTAAAAPAASASGPRQFGEFIVRCAQGKSVAPCDLYEERGDKNTGQRLIGFSIGYMPSTSHYIMQIAVPLGVSLDRGVIVSGGSFNSPKLPYRRCDQGGCYVETIIDKSLIDAFAKLGDDAKVKVAADGGKIYDFTFSFKGFSAAHDDMVAQNKAKAVSPDNTGDGK
jgi:invasion protein IalB